VKFPRPVGIDWERYVADKLHGDFDDHGENVEVNKYLTELALMEVEMEVHLDYEVIKMLQDEDENCAWECNQVRLAEISDEAQPGQAPNWAEVESQRYFDKSGVPIAPKNVKDLLKRNACKDIWFEAIEKEAKALDDRGVFEYMTLDELRERGYVTRSKKPIPMRILLSSKIKPSGEFDRAKARSVLQGDKRHMTKGIHYSVVFCASPSLVANKVMQGLAVKDNMTRFGADVNQAFTNAPCEPQEQLAVRMAEGMRKYTDTGEELYGVLRMAIYGSPLASKSWSRCLKDWLKNEMGQLKPVPTPEGQEQVWEPEPVQWIVRQMLYEPCMWEVRIEGRSTFFVIHTDDIDGVADDPRDVDLILGKFDARFGISICEPKYMLGIQRDMSVSEDGVATLQMTQVNFIEEAWDEWKQHRSGRGPPERPADGLKFTDEKGQLIIVEEEEYKRVTAQGYRSLVGTILWPARNAYPMISYAVTQLCRAMEKPSDKAWASAMHCLHYLYSIRHEGIRYRSDASPVPVCYYDSGHLQDRVDYKSFYGFVITFMGGPILWMSKKHLHVGESSSEDEYMALCHAYKAVKWLRSLLKEMGYGDLVEVPTIMLGDNKQAGRWSRYDMITNGNRFIERMYHKVKEGIEAGDIETRYIDTKLNVSDVFTKDVSKEVVRTLGPMLCGQTPWPEMPDSDEKLQDTGGVDAPKALITKRSPVMKTWGDSSTKVDAAAAAAMMAEDY